MAVHGKVAGSYARAIIDYLGDADKARTVADELSALGEVIESHAELSRVLTTGVFTEKQRREVLEEIMKKLKSGEDTKRMALVVSQQMRLRALSAIGERMHRLLQDHANVVPLHVESASALDAAEKKKVEQKFRSLLGKTVEASYAVDPNLIGGLRVTAAGKTYDGSLVGQLRAIEERLVGGHH